MAQHTGTNDADGMAAVGICESLLLALTDLKIISGQDARDLLTDVATAHTKAAADSPTPEKHRAVVEIIERMLVGKNCDRQELGPRSGLTVGAQSVRGASTEKGTRPLKFYPTNVGKSVQLKWEA